MGGRDDGHEVDEGVEEDEGCDCGGTRGCGSG